MLSRLSSKGTTSVFLHGPRAYPKHQVSKFVRVPQRIHNPTASSNKSIVRLFTNDSNVVVPPTTGNGGNNNHNQGQYGRNSRSGWSDTWSAATFVIGLTIGGIFVYTTVYLVGVFVNPKTEKSRDRPKVVVLGSGWGALGCIKEIDTNKYDVIVVSPRDSFLFTPLLNESTMGDLDPSSINEPIRNILKRFNKGNIKYYEAYCTDIVPDSQKIKCKYAIGDKDFELNYDKLIVSVGSQVNTYGIKGVKENCLFLRESKDTLAIRNKIIDNFELAYMPGQTDKEIERLLHFVVVGSGPQSIQFVNGFNDLLDNELKTMYPKLVEKVKLSYVDYKDPKNTYDAKITSYFTKNVFKPIQAKLNVIKSEIKEIDKININFEQGGKVPYGACFWMTGNSPSPLVTKIQSKRSKIQTHKNALITNQYLGVLGFENIYAIGECGTIEQNYLHNKWDDIFDALDEDKNGFIEPIEFKALVPIFSREYPQLLEYAKQAEELFDKFDINKDGKLSKEEFQQVLKLVDASVTSLPSTAQVAVQQGSYLATSLNNTLREQDLRKLFHELDIDKSGALDINELRKGLRKLGIPATKKEVREMMSASDSNNDNTIDEDEFVQFALNHQQQSAVGDWKKLSHTKIFPFRYKHLGGFEYVGYENKITNRGSQGAAILDGFGAWWLWNSIFASKMISARARLDVGINWATRKFFGRNFTR